MMISTPLQWIRRLRLQAAETDLAFLEARAPAVIAEQRARVNRLRAAAQMPTLPLISADLIRDRIERDAKRVLL